MRLRVTGPAALWALALGAVALAHPRTGGATAPAVIEPRGPSCGPLALTGRRVPVATAGELAAAVGALRSGDSIVIAPGSYRLERTLHIRGGVEDVAIRGATGRAADVVLVGRGMDNSDFGNVPHGILVSDATDVLIADLRIQDVYYHAVQVQGEQGASRVRLHGVELVDAGEQLLKVSTAGPPGPYADDGIVECSLLAYTDRARSWYTNGVDVLAGRGWVIRDNVFSRIRAPVGQLAGPAVLMWRNSVDSLVERNSFLDCDRAVALGLDRPDPAYSRDGETRYDHVGGIVRNNVIWRASGSPTGDVGITVNFAGGFAVVHNTVILNGTFPYGGIEYRWPDSSGVIAGNLLDAPIWRRDGGQARLVANLEGAAAAWFVDAAGADLHLAAGAPPVDAGPDPPAAGDDVDGQSRPAGARADAGADEWWPVTVEPSPTAAATASAVATESPPYSRAFLPAGLTR